jgi:DNA polymerase III subunit chi
VSEFLVPEQIVRFYELISPKFQADPLLLVAKLAEKAFETQASCSILVRDDAQAEDLDDKLWSYSDDSFLPHQIAGQEDDDECPILIITPAFDAPLRDVTINLRNENVAKFGTRLLEIISMDENEKQAARLRYKAFVAKGLKPSFEKI